MGSKGRVSDDCVLTITHCLVTPLIFMSMLTRTIYSMYMYML